MRHQTLHLRLVMIRNHEVIQNTAEITNTVCSIWFGLRNEAIVSLIWDFWGPKGLLCDPKTGRKLLLGQKHTEISSTVSQEEDFKKEELQDLVIWGGFPGYLRNVLLDPVQIFSLSHYNLLFSLMPSL